MLSGMERASVGHQALVVRVEEQLVEFWCGNGHRGDARASESSKPSIRQMISQSCHSPVTAGIERESQAHEWCTLLVDHNGAHLVAFAVRRADVAITQRRSTDGATASNLLSHSLGDFVGEVPGVELRDR